MRRKFFIATGTALSMVIGSTMVVSPGCAMNNEFLGLEDFQRDVLIGGLAAVLLNQLAADGGAGAPAGQDGVDGLNCWDLNGNAVEDPNEDVNSDGRWDARDCRGQDGADGADGATGADGADGQSGLNCWDLNGNGVADTSEDQNGDGILDAGDCQGADGDNGSRGSNGSTGPQGPAGQDGPDFFDIFIDDFFGFENGEAVAGSGDDQLQINIVRIDEPVLRFEEESPIGFRVAVPASYVPGNDVTMRLFLYRTGFEEGPGCFLLTLDPRRLRVGSGVEVYGDDCANVEDSRCGRRWIRLDADAEVGSVSGDKGGDDGVLIVLDLPLNTAGGLNLERDLAEVDKLAGVQFLAFEINKGGNSRDDRRYQLVGVEFFESPAGTAELVGGDVFFDEEIDPCETTDCNDNGIPDHEDIANCPIDDPSCQDCNFNRLPDECDIRDCPAEDVTCQDCNENGVPDECDLCENEQAGSVAAVAGVNLPFGFLQDGFTQELYAAAQGFMGGVAFAPDGDLLVNRCLGGPPKDKQPVFLSDLRRFDAQTTTPVNGSDVHPLVATIPSNAGCGMVNHADGNIYTNTALGVIGLDPATGANVLGDRQGFGDPGNGLGIAVDPQTGELIYVGFDGSLLGVNPLAGTSRVFSAVTAAHVQVEQIVFDTTGDFLFVASRDSLDCNLSLAGLLSVFARDGSLVREIVVNHDGGSHSPDGVAVHASTPKFVITTNCDGTISRFDFPDEDYTQEPTQSLFASGGFRGDFLQVGGDGRVYLTQNGARFGDGTTFKGSSQNSVVAICCGFNPPVPRDITLSPQTAVNLSGGQHTVIARVTMAGVVQPDVNVVFEVLSGPNAGASGAALTDDTGRAFFTYTDMGGPGLDEIQASYEAEAGVHTSNVVTKQWLPSDCSNDCNDNGVPDECELLGNDCNENGVLDECEKEVCDDGDPCTRDFCDGGCHSEPLCGPELICINGLCVECTVDQDCPKGESCVEGLCEGSD